jgi:DNA-binding transcriptional LysR family regulator
LADSSLIARKLVPIHSVLCASPDYIARHDPIQSPQDLTQHHCLTYTLLHNFST